MCKFIITAILAAILSAPMCFASTDHNAGTPLEEEEFVIRFPLKEYKTAAVTPAQESAAPAAKTTEVSVAYPQYRLAMPAVNTILDNKRETPLSNAADTGKTPAVKILEHKERYSPQPRYANEARTPAVAASPAREYQKEDLSPPVQDSADIIRARAAKAAIAQGDYAPLQSISASATTTANNIPGISNMSTDGLVGYGSGFFVTPNIIVTNFHVVKGLGNMQILYLGMPMHAVLIAKDETNDLALLKISGYITDTKVNPLPISDIRKVNVGEKVYAVGFPDPARLGFRPKITDGLINSVAGEQDNPNCFQISAPIQPGNSGGPLLNSKGQVVGVVTKRWNKKNYQNVSYAVKSNHLINLLLSLPEGIIIPEDPVFETPVDGQDIMLLARDAVVTIVRRKDG